MRQNEQYPISMAFQHISVDFSLIYIRWFSIEAWTSLDDFEIKIDTITIAEICLNEDKELKEMSILVKLKIREDKSWFKKTRSENNSDGSGDRYTADFIRLQSEE